MSGDYELMTSLPPESEYTMKLFHIRCPNVMFLASQWLRHIDFQTSHFAVTLSNSKLIYFTNFWQVKIQLIRSFLLTLDRAQLLSSLSLGKTCREKQFEPSLFDKNSRTMPIRSGIRPGQLDFLFCRPACMIFFFKLN